MPFDGPVTPFGAMVEYHPFSAKDHLDCISFGSKVLPGKFLDYALHAEGIWGVRYKMGRSSIVDVKNSIP